jgi:hypothetical protein
MTLTNPTPEQMHRRQMLMALLILFGVPILNAILQKYGIPPIVVSAPVPTLAPPQSSDTKFDAFPPIAAALLAATEDATPCAITSATPIRSAMTQIIHRRKGLLKRIHERRHPSASVVPRSKANLPAEEAPLASTKGPCLWCASPLP